MVTSYLEPNSKVEELLQTKHENTNPTTPSEVITYIGNIKKNQRPQLHLCQYAYAASNKF